MISCHKSLGILLKRKICDDHPVCRMYSLSPWKFETPVFNSVLYILILFYICDSQVGIFRPSRRLKALTRVPLTNLGESSFSSLAARRSFFSLNQRFFKIII